MTNIASKEPAIWNRNVKFNFSKLASVISKGVKGDIDKAIFELLGVVSLNEA